MEISALTRSEVKSSHAIVSPDGYINSCVPGWTRCTVNILISKEMGARFTQTLITCRPDTVLAGQTQQVQVCFYVISGQITATTNGVTKVLVSGHYLYLPEWKEYELSSPAEGTRLVSFHKTYEPHEGAAVPDTIFGNAADLPASEYLGDPAVRIKVLLPDNLSFDMAVNILTYDPGAHFPFVETHIMEHGMHFLQGQGIYRLDQDWYPVKEGDSIWMAPYCRQWFTAMGKAPAVYIYYKNVNRFPQ